MRKLIRRILAYVRRPGRTVCFRAMGFSQSTEALSRVDLCHGRRCTRDHSMAGQWSRSGHRGCLTIEDFTRLVHFLSLVTIKHADGCALGRCEGTHQIPAALEAYDLIMRPRGQSIIDSSHETGLMSCGSVGLEVEELRKHLAHRWDFITKWDTEAAVDDAIQKFELLKSQ